MVNSHTAVSTRKGLNCFVWFVVSEKRGNWELLNHYRIIMNVADQNALQEQPHNTHKVNILEKQCDSATKNCSALSNVEHEQILSISLTFVVHLLSQMKTVEEWHGKSYIGASANQTHPTGCRGFEFKSEDRVNPIWIHDGCNVITENDGKDKMTWDCFSWHVRLQLFCS